MNHKALCGQSIGGLFVYVRIATLIQYLEMVESLILYNVPKSFS